MARADDTELIDAFEEFYRSYYRNEIAELAQKYPNEQKSLYIDWQDLYRYDSDLADDFRNKPKQLREYAEEALRLYDLPVDVSLGQAHVRVRNLPEKTDIRGIRADHRGMLIAVQGIVRKATDVRPKITNAAFECQRCGTLTRIPQEGGDFQEPHECQGCERQGPFRINYDQSEFIDAQKLRVQESPEGLRGGETPQSIDINIEDDITGNVTPGDHVTATGILNLEQQGNDREKSAMFDVYMEGLTVDIEDEQFEEMDISDEDKKEIIELSNQPNIYEEMVGAIAPSIYGYEKEKQAMIFQLFSGVTKFLPDGSRTRGDLHILLIGDPGTGKCLKGDTEIVLADGQRKEIGELVEENIDQPKPVDDGVYDTVDIPVPSLTDNGTIEVRQASKVWKREAPSQMYQIQTSSGRELEVTPSHPLFVQSKGEITPKEAEELVPGEQIAASPNGTEAFATDGGYATSCGAPAAGTKESSLLGQTVSFDRIESIEKIDPDYDWVYDLEVPETHNYISEGVISHNSQLLQYIKEIAPRSVYTSGKGSSSAGLCVTGDTLIHTQEGFREIQEIVEESLPAQVDQETAKKQSTSLYTFDQDSEEIDSRDSSHVWRMPEKPCRRIETNRGKRLEASRNTPVLTCGDNGIEWTEISEITKGDHIAVPDYVRSESVERHQVGVREFLELTEEKVKLDEHSLETVRKELVETFGSLRDAAAALELSEDFIYDSLSNRHIPLEKLDRILEGIGRSRESIGFDRVMLRHGDSINLPDEFGEDLMYLLGLVFGDGDIRIDRRKGNRGCVRISNSNERILEKAIEIVSERFEKDVSIEYQEDRVPSIRIYSATIARLFSNAGMETPKENLSLHPKLTTAVHTDAFLRGFMDADGAVSARTNGGSSVLFSTISEKLARQIQFMFETYGVYAQRRERDRRGEYELQNGYIIETKHVQHFVEIYGADIDRYADAIGFGCETKQEQLAKITGKSRRRQETIPIKGALATAATDGGEFYNNVSGRDNPGRSRAAKMLKSLDLGENEPVVREAVNADLRWDEVVDATDTGEKEVFDLTVPETHNFIGNGVVTHNTAAAVRDDFGDGQQWTLEAGALVLADQGIAAIDELDKMRCVTGETLVHTPDGIVPIREFARQGEKTGSIEELESGRTIRDINGEVWTMTNEGTIESRNVTAVHEYDAPQALQEVTLESGESVTATADHPFFVLSDGKKTTKPAEKLEEGDWIYVPDTLPQQFTDGGVKTATGPEIEKESAITTAHSAILGYLAGDGNIYYNRRTSSYGIRFTNSEEELLEDFEQTCYEAFDDATPVRYPSEQREDGVGTVRLHGKAYADELINYGLNLENYDGKRIPESVTNASSEAKAAFIRALADSEASVDKRSVKIHSSSYELLLGSKMLLSEFGITSQIQTRERDKRDLYVLAITADSSLAAFNRHVGFTLNRKQQALDEACERTTGTRTILDVLPECGELFAEKRKSLRLYQAECGLNGVTYCNFENGDANFSLRAAERVITRFEERKKSAEEDVEHLSSQCSWDGLKTFKERYHVTQKELSESTEHSQQWISRHWGRDDDLRETVQVRLRSIIADVSSTQLTYLRELVRNDVKWRRVSENDDGSASQDTAKIRLQKHRLAELVGANTDAVVERADTILSTDPAASNWEELRGELERHEISFQELADSFDVAGSTISRWFTQTVNGEDFETVRKVSLDLIEAKRERMRTLRRDIGARKQPKVYDLTVEDTHNFVANGMVVHNSEDQSAMHEALEQQSYHPNSEILLADGRRVDIGEFVDQKFEANPEQAVDGVDCEILPVQDVGVHTVDLDTNEVTKTDVDRVSRHEAPEEFVEVTFSNGRTVTVTPEHPMFVEQEGEIGTIEASEISEGAFVPAPRKLPNSAQPVELADEPHRGKEKDVRLPSSLSPDLAEILGLLIAEGHSYAGSSHEIGFSNQDERLLQQFGELMKSVFGMESSDTTNAAGTVTKRYTSTKLYRWFESNFPEVMETARGKRIPAAVLGASEEEIRRFLVGAFAGDGGVESEAMSFSTASEGLARDYADALAKLGVASRIHYTHHDDAWKTYVMDNSTETFVDTVVSEADDRYEKAAQFVERSNATARHHDVLPTSGARDLRYYRVTDVETVPNEGEYECEWVYDVTVEPTNTFVSEGVVLHNSISVSKAGINATLKSRCSLLGAANPTYGRFDEYEPIGEQIDLDPPLISRFDLIFTVTDQPDEEKDAELAEHILQTNYAGELNTHRTETSTSNYTLEEVERVTEDVSPTIDAEFLRKYVAYAQRNCFPTMTEEAKSLIQEFYVNLRAQGSEEDAPVPVTARKLEALVRLAEASARVRLSDTVTEEDAQRGIDIAQYCLEDIGLDPETGEFDADMIETGTSKSQRDRIKNIKQLIASIEDEYDEGAPVDVVIERAEEEGLDASKAEHEIDKLKQKGEVYEPQTNHLRTT